MDPNYPTSKISAILFLDRVRLGLLTVDPNPDYSDRKSAQLCSILKDLLLAESELDAWIVDLGSHGCQIEDNSIGSIQCIASEED